MNRRLARVVLVAILAIDVLDGITDLRRLESPRVGGGEWLTGRLEIAAVGRSAFALAVLVLILWGSENRSFWSFAYAFFKFMLSIVVMLQVVMQVDTWTQFARAMARHWNWWHPVSAVVFSIAAILLARNRRVTFA